MTGQALSSGPPRASDDWRRPMIVMWATIVVFFFFGGAWSVVARLDEAAIAPGVVSTESNLKSIQHLEGGIVREILVRDGDKVEEGQVLVRLEPTAAKANSEVTRSQLAVALAQEARLIAERDEAQKIDFPDDVVSQMADPLVARAVADQQAQFKDRRDSLQGQLNILQARVRQLEEERNGLETQRQAGLTQVEKIDAELVGLQQLARKNLVPMTRVYAMEREKARLEGEIGKAESDIAKGAQAVGETQLQIEQVRKQFLEGVGKDLVDTRKTIAEFRERLTVAKDILDRIEIRAPLAGVIQGMKVFTVGGVVKPGDTIMEIAPLSDDLVVKAQISPNDIDNIRIGDKAEISFPAFASRKPPIFLGRVRALSRDRLIDEATRQPYFAAEVIADNTTIPRYFRERIIPGMQADAIITTGERRAIEYLLSPLRERLKRSMNEH